MYEKITDAEINKRSMAKVSTTPGRRTAFGESEMDPEALKLRFDRLSRYLAERLNEIFIGIESGALADAILIETENRSISVGDMLKRFFTGEVDDFYINLGAEGMVTWIEVALKIQEIYNGVTSGDLAASIILSDNVTLREFYDEFLNSGGSAASVYSVNGKVGAVELTASDVKARPVTWTPTAVEVGARPATWTPTASEVGARPATWTPTAGEVGADPVGTATKSVASHNSEENSHADIRLLIKGLSDRINAVLDSDDTTLDELSEIVNYIKSNKTLIDAITTGKVNVKDIIDDLVTNVADKPLSAAQGVALKALIDALDTNKLDASALADAINTALTQAKASGEFDGNGILRIEAVSSNGLEDTYRITYTNGQTQYYTITNGADGKSAFEYAQDAGYTGTENEFAQKLAAPAIEKVSQLENDAGYITDNDIPVKSVNGKAGAVELTASDVKARPDTWMPTYSEVGADKSGTASSAISSHNTNDAAHNDIRLLLQGLSDRINAVLDSDDTTLDELSEIVNYIKSNKAFIDAITTSKVNVNDIINNLTSNVSNKPLSAAQGVALKAFIDALDTNKLDASALADAINLALAQAKSSGEFDGADGERGYKIHKITTNPTSYTTTVGGFSPKYRIAISTVLSESGSPDVIKGDVVWRSYYHYPVGYVDDAYVYLGTYQNIRGATGSSVTVTSVEESNEDGGLNVVTFSDGKSLSVKNGGKGDSGKSAYQTAQEGGYTGTENEFAAQLLLLANMTAETWTFELEDGSTVTKKVIVVT